MKIHTIRPHTGNDLFGTLVCEYCNHSQKLLNGYNDNHWHRKVLPATHCDHCLRNRKGGYPTPALQNYNQGRRITDIPTDAQIEEFMSRVKGSTGGNPYV